MNKDIKRLPVSRKSTQPIEMGTGRNIDDFFKNHYGEEKVAMKKKVRFSTSNTYGMNTFEDWLNDFLQNPREFVYKYSSRIKGFNE